MTLAAGRYFPINVKDVRDPVASKGAAQQLFLTSFRAALQWRPESLLPDEERDLLPLHTKAYLYVAEVQVRLDWDRLTGSERRKLSLFLAREFDAEFVRLFAGLKKLSANVFVRAAHNISDTILLNRVLSAMEVRTGF